MSQIFKQVMNQSTNKISSIWTNINLNFSIIFSLPSLILHFLQSVASCRAQLQISQQHNFHILKCDRPSRGQHLRREPHIICKSHFFFPGPCKFLNILALSFGCISDTTIYLGFNDSISTVYFGELMTMSFCIFNHAI